MTASEGARAHILVVDDDQDIRLTIEMILESEGYSVALAANGREALERVAEHQPAMVLLDLQMPVMNGWQLLSELRSHHEQIPVVFMTAGYRAHLEAERHRADAHLSKPFEMDELLLLVKRLLDASES
jgi:CheY-like chemotaxis protein